MLGSPEVPFVPSVAEIILKTPVEWFSVATFVYWRSVPKPLTGCG